MSAEAATLAGRTEAESLMGDLVRVSRVSGPPVEDDWGNTATPTEIVYEGPGKVQSASAANLADSPVVAGAVHVVEALSLHLPVASKCRVDDVAEVLECDMDADLVGLRLTLRECPRGRYRTADRWSVDLVTR